MRKTNTRGIAHLWLVIGLTAILALIIGVGFRVNQAGKSSVAVQGKGTTPTQTETNQKTEKKESAVQNDAPSAPNKLTVVSKESLQGINTNAPTCGTRAAISQAEPSSFDLKYTKPENWAILDTYPNGVSYKSADFKSEQNFRNISTGASLSLSVGSFCKDGNGLAKDMESWAKGQTMGRETQLTYIKVASYYGVKFTHNSGENHNNHVVALLFKQDKMYAIEEQFNFSTANPYPDIIDQTLNTIEQ